MENSPPLLNYIFIYPKQSNWKSLNIPLIMSSRSMKFMTVSKVIQQLYTENCKTLLRDTLKWSTFRERYFISMNWKALLLLWQFSHIWSIYSTLFPIKISVSDFCRNWQVVSVYVCVCVYISKKPKTIIKRRAKMEGVHYLISRFTR